MNEPGDQHLENPDNPENRHQMKDRGVGGRDPSSDEESGAPEESAERESLGRRVIRSFLAPDVLEDGGRDAPLSPRGRLLFWGTVAVLGIVIVVLLVAVSVARH